MSSTCRRGLAPRDPLPSPSGPCHPSITSCHSCPSGPFTMQNSISNPAWMPSLSQGPSPNPNRDPNFKPNEPDVMSLLDQPFLLLYIYFFICPMGALLACL